MNEKFKPEKVRRYVAMSPEAVAAMDAKNAEKKPPRPYIAPRAETLQGVGEQFTAEDGSLQEIPVEQTSEEADGPSPDEIAAYFKENNDSNPSEAGDAGKAASALAEVKQILAETAKTEQADVEEEPERARDGEVGEELAAAGVREVGPQMYDSSKIRDYLAETAPTVVGVESAETVMDAPVVSESSQTVVDQKPVGSADAEEPADTLPEMAVTQQEDDEPLPVQQVEGKGPALASSTDTVIKKRGGLLGVFDRIFGSPTVTPESQTVVPVMAEDEPTQSGLEEETVNVPPVLEAETQELPPVQE